MLALTIILMIASSILGAFGVLYLKFASEKITFSLRSLVFNLKFILSLALYITVFICVKHSVTHAIYPQLCPLEGRKRRIYER